MRFLAALTFLCLHLAHVLCNPTHHHRHQHRETVWRQDDVQPACGYETCGGSWKEGMLNVHLVPHTHDDVGWLKTVDQYFMGLNNTIQQAGVQYVLDSVVQQLQQNPDRRFIYVEIAFFKRWWKQQTEDTQKTVKDLVNQNRLEFILGAWSMNDEASTHYNDIIDNHALGLKFLRQNFGACGVPRAAWQIDPFGHSREQANLFAQMGYDSLYFARLDYQDKAKRTLDKTMEMVWHGSDDIGEAGDLFTGALFRGYGPPPGFCWDIYCSDTPIQDDERLMDYNVDTIVDNFMAAAHDQARNYSTNHQIWTMGSDFQYQSAHHWYKNLDKLIHYVNARQANGSKVNVFYSTPSCYTYALHQVGQSWPSKSDDFFPYASDPHKFWTGYFTSRPALKRYVKESNRYLQVVKQLQVLSQMKHSPETQGNVAMMMEAMGVAQHHDAVSGTEKQHVADDYAQRLARGRAAGLMVRQAAMNKLMPNGSGEVPAFKTCDYLNISQCDVTEHNDQVMLTLYNPLGREVDHWVRLPVPSKTYAVVGPDGQNLAIQVLPVSAMTKAIPGRNSTADWELVFKATLPSLGWATYDVHKTTSMDRRAVTDVREFDGGDDVHIRNEFLELSFSGTNGLLKSISNLVGNTVLNVQQTLLFYNSYGNKSSGTHSSGAYVFRPNGTQAHPIKTGKAVSTVATGQLVQEVHQQFSSYASQVIRLYKGQKAAQVEWTVGPIPIEDHVGKEFISRFSTQIATNKVFYTDANGRQMLKRTRDFRPTWKLDQTEPVAGNYYPVNSRIFIKDTHTQLTVLNDRSQGGGSISDGELEIMVHRRCLYDDGLGVNENLNETAYGTGLVVRGTHYVVVESPDKSAAVHRELGEEIFMPALALLAPLRPGPLQSLKKKWSGVQTSLPPNVHLVSLEDYTQLWGGYLVRLEHMYQRGEDSRMSQPATVSLKNLFTPFEISSAEELTLGANQKLADSQRLKWKTNMSGAREVSVRPLGDDLEVELQPMQIRTFNVMLHA